MNKLFNILLSVVFLLALAPWSEAQSTDEIPKLKEIKGEKYPMDERVLIREVLEEIRK